MRIKKIKDNFYEELGMSKYDFFNNLVNEIGNFPYVVSNIYEDNSTKTTVILIVKLEFIMVMKNFFLIF